MRKYALVPCACCVCALGKFGCFVHSTRFNVGEICSDESDYFKLEYLKCAILPSGQHVGCYFVVAAGL